LGAYTIEYIQAVLTCVTHVATSLCHVALPRRSATSPNGLTV